MRRGAALGLVMVVAGCGDDSAPSTNVVALTTGPITIDGVWDEPDWDQRALAFVFADDDGTEARPFSEIRFLRDDHTLYLGMYAADEDVEATDFFQVTIGTLDVRVDPTGNVTASAPGLVAVSDVDGTVDQPGDDDEEWVVELAVPIELVDVGATPIAAQSSRCDVTKDRILRCGSIHAQLLITDRLR